VRGFASAAAARPVDPPRAAHAAGPPATDFEADSTPGKGTGHPAKPEKEPGPPPKREKKEEPEPPGQAKTPPGQAKKQAMPEEPTPPPALPATVGAEPPAVDAEAVHPAVGPESNGKAKGHEKQLRTAAGED